MNRKGFTLVELLAVVGIVALLLVIAVPAVQQSISSSKDRLYDLVVTQVKDATKQYTMKNYASINGLESTGVGFVYLSTLTSDGYIDDGVEDPKTGEGFPSTTGVWVIKDIDGVYSYSFSTTEPQYLDDLITTDLVGKSQSYQGGTYYKGTSAQILNNYVWFSGQEYRVMGINSDGSIKMVTSLPVVAISWGPTGTADYANSYARKWLNVLPAGNPLKDDYEGVFYKSLNRPEFIQDYQFCIGKQDPTSGTDTTCNTKLTDKVGLMTWWEYKIAGPNANGDGSYLDLNTMFTFLTGDTRTATNILETWTTGSLYEVEGTTFASYALNNSRTSANMRAVINLSPNVAILSGNGTSATPYRLKGDEAGNVDDCLNTRFAGEYLNFAGRKYRIISKNANGNTKIVTDNYVQSTATTSSAACSYFDLGASAANVCVSSTYCNNHFDIADGSGNYDGNQGHNIGYFLNSNASNSFWTGLGSTYQAYLDNATYYFGKWTYGQDYKETYTTASTIGYGTQNLKVGLFMYGEMLAGTNVGSAANNQNAWFINPYNSTINSSFTSYNSYSAGTLPSNTWITIRPTLNLKPTVKIVSGSGTKNTPYEITN